MTVTTEQLAEWERLANEATEGPWQVRQFPTASYGRPQFWVLDSIPDRDGKVVANAICSATATNQDASRNASFIAASRLAVPLLIQRIRELEKELANATH